MTTTPEPTGALCGAYLNHSSVEGYCPACGWETLFLGDGGYITCARLDCPTPDTASTLLERDPRTTAEAPATNPCRANARVDDDLWVRAYGEEITAAYQRARRYRAAWDNARKRARMLSAEVTRRAPLTGEYAARAHTAEAAHEEHRQQLVAALGRRDGAPGTVPQTWELLIAHAADAHRWAMEAACGASPATLRAKERADRAEATIARVRALAARWDCVQDRKTAAANIRAALGDDQPTEPTPCTGCEHQPHGDQPCPNCQCGHPVPEPADPCAHGCVAAADELTRLGQEMDAEAEPPDDTELTADEARAEVDRLSTDLYRAEDALAFVAEMCDIADREETPVTTTRVRDWLRGAQCARQVGLVITDGPMADAVHAASAEAAPSEVCCVCGSPDVTYHNYRNQPFCGPCAGCGCGQNPCVRTGVNDPAVSAEAAAEPEPLRIPEQTARDLHAALGRALGEPAPDGAVLWAAIRDHAARDTEFWTHLTTRYARLYRSGVLL